MQVLRTKSEEDPQYCRDVGRSENRGGGAVVMWWVLSAHSMAMGNLNKIKESTQMATTAIKVALAP